MRVVEGRLQSYSRTHLHEGWKGGGRGGTECGIEKNFPFECRPLFVITSGQTVGEPPAGFVLSQYQGFYFILWFFLAHTRANSLNIKQLRKVYLEMPDSY